MSGLSRVRWLTLVLLVCFAPPARAQKVDIVRLKNGDRLTCEINNLNRSVLTVSTDPLGNVSIHWGQIEGLESPRAFTLQVISGERFFGTLAAGKPGEVVVALGGGASVSLPLADIVQLTPIARSFWRRIDGTLDLGFSFAQANTETRATLNGSASYRSQSYQFGASYASQVTTRDDVERQYRADVNLNGRRYLSMRWYTIGWALFQQNDELSLDLRVGGGGGFGRELVHTNHRLWSLYGGLVYNHELYAGEPPADSTEAAVGGQFDFFSPSNNDFNITNSAVSYFNVGGRRRVRLELQSSWRHEFLADFYWSLNGFDSFDSDPPPEEKQNDFGVSFAIGWKF
jgi:uncharacterized protein DUF481